MCVQNEAQPDLAFEGPANWKANFEKVWKRFEYTNDCNMDEIGRLKSRYAWGDYIALSYVWGDDNATQEILLDGHSFLVTPHLHEILVHLRDSYEVNIGNLFVWIDAICINQADLSERAHEVKKMRMIYSQCLAVRVWLGVPDPDSAVDLIAVKDLLGSFANHCLSGHGATWTDVEERGLENGIWSACTLLSDAPYWQRLWTAQEFLLAPSISFWCGDHSFTATDIVNITILANTGISNGYFPMKTSVQLESMLIRSACTQRIVHLRPIRQEPGPDIACLHIIDLVRIAQTSKAKDLRDKVYGLLAIVDAEARERIIVNYSPSNSVEDTYIAFAIALCEAQKNLNTLARVRAHARTMPGLPSWAPNLAAEHDISDVNTYDARYRAHNTNQGLTSKPFEFSASRSLLHCSGVIVDKVHFLGASRHYSGELDMNVKMSCTGPDMDLKFVLQTEKWTASQTLGRASKFDHTGSQKEERTTQYWKRAVARVLLQDPDYEFNDGPSILDIPWVPLELAKRREPNTSIPSTFRKGTHYFDFPAEDRYWPSFYEATPIGSVFFETLYESANFLIGGKPLQSYFGPFDGGECPDPERFMWLAHDLFGGHSGMRLLTTASGLLGSGPKFALVGDVIAVLADCDMPMVLRPKTNDDGTTAYFVIGSCFVEGLMKGETALGLKQGHYEMQRLTLR